MQVAKPLRRGHESRIQRERADTAEAEAYRLLTQASVNANERSVAATRAAAAGVADAARIRLAVGIIVILVLIGTATFAALTIDFRLTSFLGSVGQVAEWLKAPVSKTGIPATVS